MHWGIYLIILAVVLLMALPFQSRGADLALSLLMIGGIVFFLGVIIKVAGLLWPAWML